MTLTIELTSEQQQRLEAEAAGQGMAFDDYALALLTHRIPAGAKALEGDGMVELPIPGSMSGAEMLAYWEREGVLQIRPDLPDSPTYARQLREQAQRRTH